jgi:hypothetical protein
MMDKDVPCEVYAVTCLSGTQAIVIILKPAGKEGFIQQPHIFKNFPRQEYAEKGNVGGDEVAFPGTVPAFREVFDTQVRRLWYPNASRHDKLCQLGS